MQYTGLWQQTGRLITHCILGWVSVWDRMWEVPSFLQFVGEEPKQYLTTIT